MRTASSTGVTTHAMVFDDPDLAVAAVKVLGQEGYHIDDVYTPFPVHGMQEAMHLPPTRLPWATLAGGLTGLTTALVLQIYTHTISWPLDVGGKTYLALPALIPVSFELTVLFAGLATGLTLFALGGLYPRLSAETPPEQVLAQATDDRYVVVVRGDSPVFSRERFETLGEELQAEKVL